MKKLYILMIILVQPLYSQSAEPPVLTDAVIEKAFVLADTNKDGILTKKEFTIFLNNAKKARKPKVVPEKELSPE